ncbi:MAG: class I SAM-dependent methyltransferase family protein [Candidatus Hydrothermarchaeota archaeon]
MKGLKVNKVRAESVRKILRERMLLDEDYKITSQGEYVYFPLKTFEKNLSKIGEIIDFQFAPIKKKRSFRERLKELGIKDFRSFDVIGDIAILQIPEKYRPLKKEIAKILLETNKNIKSVFEKRGKVEEEYRLAPLSFLAGSKNTITVHREHGCFFELDVQKVYFSPRLSYERLRVAKKVKEEFVLDMFAGVGPFSIVIAKHSKARKVYAVDKNPEAFGYLKRNIELNKVNNVIPILDDAKNIRIKCDRIIMNLPHSSHEYLIYALRNLKRGGVVHYYFTSQGEDMFEKGTEEFNKHCKEFEVLEERIVRSYAPRKYHCVLDVRVEDVGDNSI